MSSPVIIIDSREQRPWSFSSQLETRVQGLETGDYSLEGFQGLVAIERKSLGDLVGSLTQGRKRFEAELERMLEFRFKCLVVEAFLHDVTQWRYRSKAKPSSILGSCVSIMLRGIPVIWAGDAREAATWAERTLVKAHRKLAEEGGGSVVGSTSAL